MSLTPDQIHEKYMKGEYGRTPPLKELYDYYRNRQKKGYCAYCSKKLTGRQRVWCSPTCSAKPSFGVVEWGKVRGEVLERDNYTCVECGDKPLVPEVDHIIAFALDPSKYLDKDNLRTLCHDCHIEKTKSDRIKIKLHKSNQKTLEESS